MTVDEMLVNLIEMMSALNPAEMPGDEWFHYATTLAGIAQAQAAQRQADAMERIADIMKSEQSSSIADTIEAMADAARYQRK